MNFNSANTWLDAPKRMGWRSRLVGSLGLLLLVILVIVYGLIPKIAEVRWKVSHRAYLEGLALGEKHEYLAAANKFKECEAYSDSIGQDASAIRGLIGHMLDLGGKSADGIVYLNRSLEEKFSSTVCVYKLEYLAREQGLKEALSWLEKEDLTAFDRAKVTRDFLLTIDDPKRALPYLLDEFERLRGFEHFDVNLKHDGSLGQYFYLLCDLAQTYRETGDLDKADRFSSMGISVAKAWGMQDCLRCRITRVQIFLDRKNWREAESELELAEAFEVKRDQAGKEAKLGELRKRLMNERQPMDGR